MKPTAAVLYESSGVMREALRSLGIDAYSCDLQAADDGSPYHFQQDAYELIAPHIGAPSKFDIIIMHPTCTAMCVSGNHVYAEGKDKYIERVQAVRYTEKIWHTACTQADVVILENPTGVLPTMSSLPKPQYIQPYECGDDASKRTGLFMHGARRMEIDPSLRVAGRMVSHNGKMVERWSNQTDSGQNKLGPSEDRRKVRSKTYPGIARVVAAHAVAEYHRLQAIAA